ncbi:hypothetical protein LCGC14_0366660 [marine sediment metagenome]|uniref:Sulfatase-modifying factor enzyme-like domain-containing protein n=1 Tax=marine sediment metagenome TaxID=412755 RepID=A0A0F9TCC7_9ZZZZ|nr:PEP-CTERM sorting domain-containing protein [Phycisphaerae bacterium]HDZ43181.1 PEP-CTERM sorting domain-containing protein [Phycisphaerae bacterium]
MPCIASRMWYHMREDISPHTRRTRTMRHIAITMVILLVCAGLAQAGIRADLSGDAVVDFATTMDMPFMAVGNMGNAGEWSGENYGIPSPGPAETWGYGPDQICGAVDYAYSIGKFEVTAGQYTEFLNAVAITDAYGLYNTDMWEHSRGNKIQRSGADGSYVYSVAAEREDRPVNFISWGDAARLANWMTNGMPTGVQDLTTTEDGSYFLDGALTGVRKADARYVIPSEDEWYKAAYHKNNGATSDYYIFPTSTDVIPSSAVIDPDPGNNANYTYPGSIGSPYWRTEVGEYENTVSAYGAYDMGGNVMEWNEAEILGQRGVRGGAVMLNWGMNAANRHHLAAIDSGSLIGLRLVRLALPGDFDGDGDVDADDIDLMAGYIRTSVPPTGADYDVDGDGDVDEDDMIYHVENLVELTDGSGRIGTQRGDFNLDGVVNATDLAIMKANFGSSGVGYAAGNTNYDVVINATDLALLKATFGYVAPAGAVPEPVTISLLALGGLGVLRRRSTIRRGRALASQSHR